MSDSDPVSVDELSKRSKPAVRTGSFLGRGSFVSLVEDDASEKKTWLQKWIGVLSMVLLIITWVVQSELAQAVQDDNWSKPMLIVWYNHSSMALMLPFQMGWNWWFGKGSLSDTMRDSNLGVVTMLKWSVLLCAVYTFGSALLTLL